MPSVAQVIRRRRNRKVRRKGRGRRSALWLFLLVCLPSMLALAPVLAGFGLSLWLYGRAASALPAAEDRIKSDATAGVTQFYDRVGKRVIHSVVDPLGEKGRWLKLGDMPPGFIDATLLASERKLPDEGASFDPLLTLLQLWRYILGLPLKRTEASLASWRARQFCPGPKRAAWTGLCWKSFCPPRASARCRLRNCWNGGSTASITDHDAYGIEAAAQVYLGKSAESLTLLEAAVLAAVGAEPSVNPFSAGGARKGRRGRPAFQDARKRDDRRNGI